MADNRDALLSQLLEAYAPWYTFETEGLTAPMAAAGQFHEHGTGFMLVRKAEMWSADTHEYLYIFSLPTLTEAAFADCVEQARALGEPLVRPDKDHMSSYITALILCDEADEAALRALRHYHRRKSFQFSLKGWMEIHTACVVLRGDIITSNGDGRRTREFLKNVLHPRKKDLWYKLFKK